MESQIEIEREWTILDRIYEKLHQGYIDACRRFNSFQEMSEATALLKRRKQIEAQLYRVEEAIRGCEDICEDMTRFSTLYDDIMEHHKGMEHLERQIGIAQMNDGLTPDSPTPKAKALRNKSKKRFKDGSRLSKELERINNHCLDGYYNSRLEKALEVVNPFYYQFSWFWRLMISLSLCWKSGFKSGEVEHLSWQNYKFLSIAHRTKLWLQKWAFGLECDLKNIRDQWKQAEDLLSKQKEEALVALKRHAEQEVLWSRRDSERLKKYLESGRASQSQLLDRPIHKAKTQSVKVRVRDKYRRNKKLAPKSTKQELGTLRWKLFVSDDHLKHQIELPDITDENFVASLSKAFAVVECPADADDIARLLRTITNHSIVSIRRRKEISYAEPKGWKIFRCGKFRILMDIKEDAQANLVKGRFIVRYRKDAYFQ